MRTLRDFVGVLDLHLAIVVVLALAATWLCRRFDVVAELPASLIGVAVVFPIVFSIHAAYRRREEALRAIANIQGDGTALVLAARHWVAEPDPDLERGVAAAVGDVLTAMAAFLRDRSRTSDDRRRVHTALARLSRQVQRLRGAGVAPPEMARAHDSLRMIYAWFEELANIADYRTPQSLRAYSKVFLNAFPLLFAPQFALLGAQYGDAIGYGIAVVYGVVLVALDNVQDRLEDPFDLDGIDDIDLELHARQRLALDGLRDAEDG
ncbi:MAG: hypothetical protein IPM29_21330 [Planctomycetes bacterium]|nr:hypothetical protein [Planctomycetota bacterium]